MHGPLNVKYLKSMKEIVFVLLFSYQFYYLLVKTFYVVFILCGK